MQFLNNYLKENFDVNTPNYKKAKEVIELIENEFGNCQLVAKTKGDGNCLIRAILVYLYNSRDKNVMFEILSGLLDDDEILKLNCHFTENRNITDEIEDIIIKLCTNVREFIEQKWDYPFDIKEHMVQYINAIDGLAMKMVMRMFCVNELQVWSLNYDETGYLYTYKIDENTFFKKEITGFKVSLICAQGRCHYSPIIY